MRGISQIGSFLGRFVGLAENAGMYAAQQDRKGMAAQLISSKKK